MSLKIIWGDIVRETTDALVTLASREARVGSGVDKSVHKAAGGFATTQMNAIRRQFLVGLGALSVTGYAVAVLPVDRVNPFLGTSADGHCWPGATVPFALVQPSPDTGYHDWDYVAGYQHEDARILGFSQTHNSGGGGPIFGDIGIMADGDDGRKVIEEAHPGYYRVGFKSGVTAEIAATDHGAVYRFTYPEKRRRADIRVDLNSGIYNGTWSSKRIDILELDDSPSDGLDGLNLRDGYVKNRRVGYSVRFDPAPVAKRAEGRRRFRGPCCVSAGRGAATSGSPCGTSRRGIPSSVQRRSTGAQSERRSTGATSSAVANSSSRCRSDRC